MKATQQSRGAMQSLLYLVVAAGALLAQFFGLPAAADPPGHITGIGGVFVTSKDPKALAAWYRDTLGIPLEAWGGAVLKYDAPDHPPVAVWNAFPSGASYLAPSRREFMLDFAVDNLDAFVARLKTKGVTILKQEDAGPTGKFAWILDPDETKIELWQPAKP